MGLNAFATRSPAQPLDVAPKINAFSNMTSPAPAPVAAQAQRPTANAFAAPMRVQPKAPEPSMAGQAIKAFANGFVGRDQVAKIDDRYKADAQAKAKSALIWMQQTAAQPAEQRAAFTLQSAQDIARDTGQPYEAIVASARDPNAFSDEALGGAIAKFSALAGVAPVVPDKMSEYEAAQIKLKEQEAAAGPKPQIYSTSKGLVEAAPGTDPRVVFATEPEEKPPWVGAVKGPDGQWSFDPNYIKGYQEMHPPSASGSGGQRAPSGYRWSEDGSELEPIEGGPHDPLRSGVEIDPKIISLETQQSGKWMPIQNNFADIRANFDRISTLAKNKNSASDLGLIVSFTKMLDPGSVAREGEVQLTQQAAGLLDQASVWLPRLQSGKTLLPENVRQMYVDAARSMFGSYEKTYQGLARDTQSRALQYGLSPDRIMLGYDAPAPMNGKAAASPAMQLGIRAYAKQSNLPAEAITEFLSNPSTPQEIAEFNDEFGAGQAEAILKAMQSGR